jgi:hypothetical protein
MLFNRFVNKLHSIFNEQMSCLFWADAFLIMSWTAAWLESTSSTFSNQI